jgi:putative ATP-dependent endonuclease of OLD family
MTIYDITVQYFRGIHQVEKLQCGKITTLVGKNDAGKSSLVKALDAFFNENIDKKDITKGIPDDARTSITVRFNPSLDLHPLLLDEDRKFSMTKEFSFIPSSGKLNIKTYYTCYDIDHDAINNCFGVKENDLNKYFETLGQEYKRSGSGITNLSKIENLDDLTKELGRKEKKHLIKDLKYVQERYYPELELPQYSLFDAEANLDVSNTEFQKQFKKLIQDTIFSDLKESEDDISNLELTKRFEQSIKTDLSTEVDIIAQYMKKNVPDLEKIEPAIICNWNNLVKFDLELKFTGEEHAIPLSNKGSGFKRLLMVAYFEYLANRKDSDYHIFAIEEPETYLHPSLQNDLLNSIVTISEDAQFFLTTHSPIFAGATDLSDVIIVKKENELSTFPQYAYDELMKIIVEELGIKPDYNLLRNAKFLIFVEGYSDIHFLNNYATTVLQKDLEKDGILCVIGGGASLKNYADLDLFKKLSSHTNQYAVLIDSDCGDEAQKEGNLKKQEKLRKHCDTDEAMFCMLSKNTIENYCHPEVIRKVYIGDCIIGDTFEAYKTVEIIIDDCTDVKNYLSTLEMKRFKKGKHIKVFETMTKEQWLEMDDKNEIGQFIDSVYSKI